MDRKTMRIFVGPWYIPGRQHIGSSHQYSLSHISLHIESIFNQQTKI